MSAVMLLPGTNGSLLLVQRTVTRTIVLQETIGKEEAQKKRRQGTMTTTKNDFEIFKRMTGSLNDDSTRTKCEDEDLNSPLFPLPCLYSAVIDSGPLKL
ncbi:hypothetical protein STEG23_034078 [Scotinomys teguina]